MGKSTRNGHFQLQTVSSPEGRPEWLLFFVLFCHAPRASGPASGFNESFLVLVIGSDIRVAMRANKFTSILRP